MGLSQKQAVSLSVTLWGRPLRRASGSTEVVVLSGQQGGSGE